MRRAAGALALALTAACASPAPPPRSAAALAPPAPPWEIPAADLGTQRLFRVHYDGPQGEGSVKVTLRLAAADRYQVQAADPLGRPLWGLDVAAGGGLWIDHRQELTCRLAGSFELAGVPLAPFPLLALPPLLLGRLPAAPAMGAGGQGGTTGTARGAAGAGRLDFRDAEGRRWTARSAGGRPLSWTLWGDDGEPRISWTLSDGEAILSDRGQRAQLRWREVVSERLAGALAPLPVPADYRETDCREAYGS
jgi:hypothetical protein